MVHVPFNDIPPGTDPELVKAKLYARVKMGSGPDACWEWTGAANKPNGYGLISIAGRDRQTHRVSWVLEGGPIPDGTMVLHRCDNPPCVRPSHLFLGTAKDNVDDMVSKGRHRFGERVKGAKLTNAQATAILGDERPYRDIASDYGVSAFTVMGIKTGTQWVHLDGERKRRRPPVTLTYRGCSQRLHEWAKELGLPFTTLSARLKRGWSVEDALTTPALSRTEVAHFSHARRKGVI